MSPENKGGSVFGMDRSFHDSCSRLSFAGFHGSALCHPRRYDHRGVRKKGNSSRPNGEVCPNSREQRGRSPSTAVIGP